MAQDQLDMWFSHTPDTLPMDCEYINALASRPWPTSETFQTYISGVNRMAMAMPSCCFQETVCNNGDIHVSWEKSATAYGLKEMKMRWSNTMELYPFAMQTSEFGVLRSMISVDATLDGWKVTSELNRTPAPMPMMKAPAIRALVRFLENPLSPPPFGPAAAHADLCGQPPPNLAKSTLRGFFHPD